MATCMSGRHKFRSNGESPDPGVAAPEADNKCRTGVLAKGEQAGERPTRLLACRPTQGRVEQ